MNLDEQKAAIINKLGPLRDAINDIEKADTQLSFIAAVGKLTTAMLKIKQEQDDPLKQ